MTTNYVLAIGCAVLAGVLAVIFVFAIVLGDSINDRNNRREALQRAGDTPIPEVREMARLEGGWARVSFGIGMEVILVAVALIAGGTLWATGNLHMPSIDVPVIGSDDAPAQHQHPRHHKAVGMSGVTVVGHLPRGVPDYDREAQFGDWVSTGDGCDMRQQILRRDLVDDQLRDDGCTMAAGVLHDPYTGHTIHYTDEDYLAVQIDHIVPLGLAWRSGAYEWTQEQREAYANDPKVLLAVDGPTNGAKSDQSLSQWLPDHHVCGYERHYLRVIKTYDLVITRADARTVRTSRC